MIAKKSIEGGDDLDGMPDSMRQLLAMQAIESGRPFPRQLMGRPGGPVAQYGSGGMLMNADPNGSGKVGEFESSGFTRQTRSLTTRSYSSLHLSLPERRNLAPSRSECHGPRHLLFA